MIAMPPLVRLFGLGLLLAGSAVAGWQPIDSITNRDTSDLTAQSNARSVACDAAGIIHVVWRGRQGARRQVWYSRYDAPSGHWSQNATLTNSPEGVCGPACVLGSNGDFYVSYEDSASGMLHLLRRDQTSVWTRLDSLAGQQGDSMVSLCSDNNGTLHVVWRTEGSPSPAVRYVSYGQNGWSSVDTVAAGATWPSIACSPEGTVMVVWWASGNQVLSRRRVGNDWLAVEVVYNTDLSRDPCVSWGADSFYVAWLAGSLTRERAMVRSWCNNGWGDTAKVSTTYVGQAGVAVAVEEDGALHVVWSGNDSSSPSYNQIQYRTRPAGDTWLAQEHLTVGANGTRERVSLAARDGRVQVAWSDQPAPSEPFAVRLRRYERVHDVGVMRIARPAGVVDSGTVVQPAAWVKNFGDLPEVNVPVRFSFGAYQNQKLVPALAPGETASVVFDTDTAIVRGWNVVTCSTGLTGDANTGNDAVRDSFFVRVQDMAATAIVVPEDTVDTDSLAPIVRVHNMGNVETNATVHARIDSTPYHDSLVVRFHPDSDSLVTFAEWATMTGTFTFRCSVAYAPDVHHENDALSKQFRVVVTDVGVSSIIAPVNWADSGQFMMPRAIIRNFGTAAAACSVLLRIDSTYCRTMWVSPIDPGDSATASFDTWQPIERGMHAVRCSTMLTGDRNPGNDMQSCSVFVRVHDAAALRILCPVGVISRGEMHPQVMLANRGNDVASIPARFEILGNSGRVYLDSVTVALRAGDSMEAEFPLWPAQSGTFIGVCSTALGGDMQHGNDTLRRGFRVARVDAAALAIRVPPDTISEGWVEPRLLVANYGDAPAEFCAHFTCDRQGSVVYHDSVFVSPDSMIQEEVTFREWKALPGDYSLLATVALGDDENPHNDSVSAAVHVESLESRQWRERAPVPRGPRGRPVKDGGSLVAVADGLLALKGANGREWYRYSAAADSWAALADMALGVDGHKVKAGASLCWDGSNAVFALKGTGTREFWRYDIPGDSWQPLASLPEHTRGVRYGSGLVFVPVEDTDKVFMVKGSNTRDFLVYWVRQNEWHARRPLPPGLDTTNARHGTCLALLGGRVFCLKGRTTEFYEYFTDGDSWVERAALPRLGRGMQWKKPAKGAALASDGSRFLYAFKGGRSNEFWRYDTRGDSWSQLDDIPRGSRRRKVGHGGALAWLGGRAYALKGGGSNEFWCFDPLAALAALPEPLRGTAVEADVLALPFVRHPPVVRRCGSVTEYPVPQGATGVLVIDAAGQVVTRRAAAHPMVELRFGRPGVYFVVMTGDSGSFVAKTTVVR
ncbi:MAG: hypothetical protein NTX53_11160 [candidate division WOR-3 bacterium]|nr:hypothetical protein [candidate division WOR-3 bacterium]